MQLLDSDWPGNILAGLNFRAQENGLMSPDGVCAISAGPDGHKTTFDTGKEFQCSYFDNQLGVQQLTK